MTSAPALEPSALLAARWIGDLRFDDLPTQVVADVRLRILDILGVALAAVQTPIGRSVRAAALLLGRGEEARLLGTGDRVPAASAALVNGTLAHAMDFDDTHNATIIHASAPVVSAALAIAEARDLTGMELALAVAAGNELTCRIGLVAPGAFHRHGLHPTGLIGTVGAAMTAARLLGLGADAIANAAGIAGSQASGILESFSDGSWAKTLHPGWAAHAGIVAAQLAAAGFTGPATVLEGRFGLFRSHLQEEDVRAAFLFEAIADGLGRRWEALDSSFKLYPCAHVIHPFVNAALALARQSRFDARDIVRIEATVAPLSIPVVCEPRAAKLRPATPTHARASLPYAVAAALRQHALGTNAYDAEAIADPGTLALAARVEVVPDPNPVPPGTFRGAIRIETRDGRRFERSESVNQGGHEARITAEQVEEKFRACASTVLGAQRCEAVVQTTRRLEELTSVRALVDLCVT